MLSRSARSALKTSSIRVLVVDDYGPWRHFVCSTLQIHSEWQIVGEASDGLEAVQKGAALQPDPCRTNEAINSLHEAGRSGNSDIFFEGLPDKLAIRYRRGIQE
jgi:hypothetical protein